jgi:hypothetical protein
VALGRLARLTTASNIHRDVRQRVRVLPAGLRPNCFLASSYFISPLILRRANSAELPVVVQALGAMGATLANIENAPLALKRMTLTHSFVTVPELGGKVVDHYQVCTRCACRNAAALAVAAALPLT